MKTFTQYITEAQKVKELSDQQLKTGAWYDARKNVFIPLKKSFEHISTLEDYTGEKITDSVGDVLGDKLDDLMEKGMVRISSDYASPTKSPYDILINGNAFQIEKMLRKHSDSLIHPKAKSITIEHYSGGRWSTVVYKLPRDEDKLYDTWMMP